MEIDRRVHIVALASGLALTSFTATSGLPTSGITPWTIFVFFALGAMAIYAPTLFLWAARTCSQTRWVHVTAIALGAITAFGWYSQATEQLEGVGLSFAQLDADGKFSVTMATLGAFLQFPMFIYLVAGARRVSRLPKQSIHLVSPYAGAFAVIVGLKMWGTGSTNSSFAGVVFGTLGAILASGAAYVAYGFSRLLRRADTPPSATEQPDTPRAPAATD